ncbi:MAG: hypothetical protein COU08_04250 [Candidatus Harrisonbacteria bacterium CG10_big_fil_rev_8_21_14_0_10_42_17]|uniref:Secreted protein n=1 Tax=Candidatus Harrisonbacteria bacterium CG10_big_fil_rev_8_21_14_0_10_42_17 TaxID=1974584 RepID=A0A2M6WGX3_9BACT|nr:MAG: hypothetical protein COU08_04250 [Candidatus Harrisonbacteria bacterium CG10_big_fil_rev_8_21_14_0_10_42_17]
MKNTLFNNISIIFSLLALLAITAFAQSTWAEPTIAPTGCTPGTQGCDVPVNDSANTQVKVGNLIANNLNGVVGVYGGEANIRTGTDARIDLKSDGQQPLIQFTDTKSDNPGPYQRTGYIDFELTTNPPSSGYDVKMKITAPSSGFPQGVVTFEGDPAKEITDVRVGIGTTDPQSTLQIVNAPGRYNYLRLPFFAYRGGSIGNAPAPIKCFTPADDGRMVADISGALFICSNIPGLGYQWKIISFNQVNTPG